MSWWEGKWSEKEYWKDWGEGWWSTGSSGSGQGSQWQASDWQGSDWQGSSWPSYTDEQLEEWKKSRYDDEETAKRKEKLLKEGLRGRGKFGFLDELGALILDTNESPLSKVPLESKLHVSIGYKDDINAEDLAHLQKEYGTDQDYHFRFSGIGSGLSGSLDPKEDRVAKDEVVQRLYRESMRKAGPLHISL